jgi:hypothetical protein
MRRQPLPAGITFVLQILCREAGALAEAKRLTRLDENAVIAVVELYVLRVMLFAGAPPRRVLGVDGGAERGQIRRHMGYLMVWLHPDKNGMPERTAFARRVLEAWRQIEMGTEVSEPGPLFEARRNRKTSFLFPWITPPPERAAHFRLLANLRTRWRIWRSV